MSSAYRTQAESNLVQQIKLTRASAVIANAENSNKGKSKGTGTIMNPAHDNSVDQTKSLKPPKPIALGSDADLRTQVLCLQSEPKANKERQFEGLEKLKIAKKDRHTVALNEFSVFLDNKSESIEADLLTLSRNMRENVEQIDAELAKYYTRIQQDRNLVVQNRGGIDNMLVDMQIIVRRRTTEIETFGVKIEQLESDRAEVVGNEIKRLVDTLIQIAHQLRDEIEHTVETEIFDLNSVLTSNRCAHLQLMGMLREGQVKAEIDTQHRWEVCLCRWRTLRHEKAIADFHRDICSTEFTEPHDRAEFLRAISSRQVERHQHRTVAFEQLGAMNSSSIKSSVVEGIQATLVSINDDELTAVQDCYNGLSSLRAEQGRRSEYRMESLRKELHSFGALEVEPDFLAISVQLKAYTEDPSLTELWRLSGGFKSDLLVVLGDMDKDEIFYERFLSVTKSVMENLVSGF